MLVQLQHGTGAFDARSYGGQVFIKAFEFDFEETDTYATGGVDCDIAVFFNGRPHWAIIPPKDGYVFEYDAENKKLKIYEVGEDSGDAEPGALAEVANQADISGLGKVGILAWGL